MSKRKAKMGQQDLVAKGSPPKSPFARMTEEFQCPGCVCGSDVTCGYYEQRASDSHEKTWRDSNTMKMRFWTCAAPPNWDKFNVPVWKLVKGGYTFVRTYLPRVNESFTDVIEGEATVPEPAVDVAPFYDTFD
jgi:gamma-glutamylcysteine synthetase